MSTGTSGALQMAAPLQVILEAELSSGNAIAEVSSWPPKCRLLVVLRHPFHAPYSTLAGIEYADVNDPHYWKSEYRLVDGEEVLACGFR
jgi:hypothetical protein